MGSDHYLKLTLDRWGYAKYEMVCKAPLESFCHQDISCGCEDIYGTTFRDGKAYHSVYNDIKDDGSEIEHECNLNQDTCIYKDWLAETDEAVEGSDWSGVHIPVKPEWEGDCYTFHLHDPNPCAGCSFIGLEKCDHD